MKEKITKLPKDWKWVNLSKVVTFHQGYGFPKELQGNKIGEYPFYKVGDISKNVKSGNRNLITCDNFIDESILLKLKAKPYPINTIVFAKIGEGLKLNRRGIIKTTGIVDNNAMGLKAIESLCHDLYLYHFFNTVKLEDYSKATTVPSVRKSEIEEIQFPLPPLEIQQAIVSKIEELFSELDKGIDNLKTAQLQLKTYRQSVLKWAFEGKKRILFENIIESSQNGLSKRTGLDGDEFNVLRLADIKNNCIVFDNPRKIKMTSSEILKYKLNEKDLVCIRVNGSKDLVGKIVYVTKNDTNNKWAFCDHFIRFTIKENFDSKFIYHYFQSMEVRKFIHDNMVTSAGQNTVSQVTIKNVLVPSCNFEEQQLIVQEIESRLSVADKMEESIAQSLQQAEALRQSILKKAFAGELVEL